MIVNRIRDEIVVGMVIPKPDAMADFIVKGWGKRRNNPALVYTIPNHKTPERPYQKGITEKEFEKAYEQVETEGEFPIMIYRNMSEYMNWRSIRIIVIFF